MITKPANAIKRDLARKWGKMNGYEMVSRVVITNKPHLVPLVMPVRSSMPAGYQFAMLPMPQTLPVEEDDWVDEED